MESCRHDFALANQDRIAILAGQYLYIFAGGSDLRRANKHHLQRLVSQSGSTFANRTVNLPAIGIATNTNVQCSQGLLWRVFHLPGQQDRARTGAQCWLGAHKIPQLFQETVLSQKIQKSAGLSSWNHD